MMMDSCYDDNDEVVETAINLLYKISHVSKCRQMLLSNGALRVLASTQLLQKRE
jgi:hypothetical protein